MNCVLTCSQGELAARTQEDEGRSIWLVAAQRVCHTRVQRWTAGEARVR